MTTYRKTDIGRFEFEPADHESDILHDGILWLAAKGVFEWRNNTGVAMHPKTGQHVKFGIPGGSDLLCVVPPFGRFLGVETKAKLGRQSDKQKAFERAVRNAGGVYVLAKTIEEIRIGFEEAQRIAGLGLIELQAIHDALSFTSERCGLVSDAHLRAEPIVAALLAGRA